ncbi:hypothetical protein [Paenibacillus sp. YYML68]|uniref:hypothetical protein n=1 Tax=Paenibacillus sp. YYML68 TaxID=2909250 RepID=UPI0024905571|nr:hypothetical protein [Paenibacillus sp. YYML68]
MMKIKKVAASLAVSAIVASVAVFGVSATNAPAKNDSLGAEATTPMEVDSIIVNDSISGRKYEHSFSIPEHYGWVKVWVHNTSSEEITVNVTQGTLTGNSKLLFKVAAGQTGTGYASSPWSTGTHWVSITGKNSGDLSGSLSVKLATTQAELN